MPLSSMKSHTAFRKPPQLDQGYPLGTPAPTNSRVLQLPGALGAPELGPGCHCWLPLTASTCLADEGDETMEPIPTRVLLQGWCGRLLPAAGHSHCLQETL